MPIVRIMTVWAPLMTYIFIALGHGSLFTYLVVETRKETWKLLSVIKALLLSLGFSINKKTNYSLCTLVKAKYSYLVNLSD